MFEREFFFSIVWYVNSHRYTVPWARENHDKIPTRPRNFDCSSKVWKFVGHERSSQSTCKLRRIRKKWCSIHWFRQIWQLGGTDPPPPLKILFRQLLVTKSTIWFKTNIIFWTSVQNWVDSCVLNKSEKVFFFEKNPCTPPSRMVWLMLTIFSIAQSFLDGSFSSSNSTEILMRQFCVQNFSSIRRSWEELSC